MPLSKTTMWEDSCFWPQTLGWAGEGIHQVEEGWSQMWSSSPLPSRWEVAKARLGFRAGSTDPCREAGLVAGKSWRKQLLWWCPRSGSGRRLGPRERAGEVQWCWRTSSPRPAWPWGLPSAVHAPRVLSRPLYWVTCWVVGEAGSQHLGHGSLRRGPGRRLWADAKVRGISWSLLEAQGCLSILFMVLDSAVV